MIIHINSEEQFNEAIAGKKCLVDFYAVWCGPCSMLAPTIDKIAYERGDINVLKVDVDQNPDIARRYNVRSIPTLILFDPGQAPKVQIGFLPEAALRNFIGI